MDRIYKGNNCSGGEKEQDIEFHEGVQHNENKSNSNNELNSMISFLNEPDQENGQKCEHEVEELNSISIEDKQLQKDMNLCGEIIVQSSDIAEQS